MGFKLKKKNSGEETVRKASGPGFLQNYRREQKSLRVYLAKQKNLSHLF